ncbi:MAG: hypothetical protein PGN13_06910 [Patulibacter minatonensis]
MFKLETPDLHRMPVTPHRRILAPSGLAIAALLAAAGSAEARAKPAGPTLAIESKVCNTGTEADARSAVVTASAVLRGTGDEVQMRFTVQQRATAKATWRTVFAKTGDLGVWATSDAGADGLRYTKTINGLAEGQQYRVQVDARGIAAGGKVVTKVTRKTYTCVQPQLSAHLLLSGVARVRTADDAVTLKAAVRNSGKQASAPPVVVVRDASTQAVLGQVTGSAVTGRSTSTITVPISSCPGKVVVTVQETGVALTELAPDQTMTFDCTIAKQAERSSTR